MTERAQIAKEMQRLTERGKELAEEHAKLLMEFELLQQRIAALDQESLKNSN